MKIMKVIDQRRPEYVPFEELEEGSLFRLPKEAIIAIKIYPITDDAHDTFNYVDVQTGETGYAFDCEQVEEFPKAKIEIH